MTTKTFEENCTKQYPQDGFLMVRDSWATYYYNPEEVRYFYVR